ncbi:hypothetical protein AOLI_G00260370 [Acnodon oligacanthus]
MTVVKASGVNINMFGTNVTIESIAIPTTALAILAAAAVIFIYLQNRKAPATGGRLLPPPSQSSIPSPPPCSFSPSRPSPCSFSSTASDPSPPPTIPPRPFPPSSPPLPPRPHLFANPRTADGQKEQNPWPKQTEGPSRLGLSKELTQVKLRSTEKHPGGNNKSERHADPFTEELKRKINPYYTT